VVPVEIGALVEATASLGPAGPLKGLFDVSGLEILTPQPDSILNVGETEAPLAGVSLKWRGIDSLKVYLEEPALAEPGATPARAYLAWLSSAPKQGTVVTLPTSFGHEENVLIAEGSDTAGNRFTDEVCFFVFSPSLIANETPLTSVTQALDAGRLQLAPNRFLLPSVVDGYDLLYADGKGDPEISEHLRRNGLRPIALKRNSGTMVTAIRMDGRDALEFAFSGTRPSPLDDEPIDGEELVWEDIVEADPVERLDLKYLQTFEDYDAHGSNVGAIIRSQIIQQARTKLGLPPSEGGKSVEYRRQLDRANQRLGWAALDVALFFVGEAVAKYAFSFAEFLFLRALRLFGRGGEAALEVIPATAQRLDDLVLPTTSARATDLAKGYRAAQLRTRLVSPNLANSAMQQVVSFSADLGVWATEQAVAHPQIQLGAGAQPVCCAGANMGGAATGQFDRVYVVKNVDGSLQRVVIIEAKGGKRLFNPLAARSVGRRVTIAGEAKFAAQGTKEYIEAVARLMQKSSDSVVAAAGEDIAEALLTKKVEYYWVTARWAGHRARGGAGLVTGIARLARVYRAVL
jgi:hypothetical protein